MNDIYRRIGWLAALAFGAGVVGVLFGLLFGGMAGAVAATVLSVGAAIWFVLGLVQDSGSDDREMPTTRTMMGVMGMLGAAVVVAVILLAGSRS